jgi:outer membrane lipoprotein-sorting protein
MGLSSKLKFKITYCILLVIAIILLCFASTRLIFGGDEETFKVVSHNFRNVTSIQYEEVKESAGIGDGRQVKRSMVTFVFPDKLRIDTNGSGRSVEIYNNNQYIYYNEMNNKIKIKECFPPESPYTTEIEKKMANILGGGDYEFFGYEEKENKKLEVIGIRSKVDGHSYMHKLWITDINDVVLPTKEEYFIDNVVVLKTTYTYFKVNQPVKPDIFEVTSLPKTEIIKDGVVPRYVDSFEEAQEYLNFKLIIPPNVPLGFIPGEIAVIPPAKKPSFYCIYFNDGFRIYLNEKKFEGEFNSNAKIGDYICEIVRKDEEIYIGWVQNNVHITLSADEEILRDLISVAENIAGGKLVNSEDLN